MEVHVTGELEAKLTHSAAQQGRNPDDLVQDVLASYFEEEARFIEAVKRGEEAPAALVRPCAPSILMLIGVA